MRIFDINSGLRDEYAEYEPPVSAVHPWARSYPGLQKDMPRYDLLNMPPWSLAFCDDITLAHKVKGGRPRMLLAYDCVTGGIRVKHERSKADHGPALHEIISEEALDKRPYKVTIGSDGCGSMVHLRNAAKERGLDHWPLPPYAYKLNPVEGAIRHFKESVTCALMGAVTPGGVLTEECAPWAADYVAWWNERFQSDRFSHLLDGRSDSSPWRLNTGTAPDLSEAVPFGCPGYAYVAEPLRSQRGRPKHLRAEPVVFVGYQHMYSNVYKCLTQHGTIVHTRKVEWDMETQLGMFPPVRFSDLPRREGGGHRRFNCLRRAKPPPRPAPRR
jgi:hypothetical protein